MIVIGNDRGHSELRVFDSDVHLHEAPSELARYCAQPWRRSMELMSDDGYVDIRGLSHVAQLDPPLPGTIPGRTASREDVAHQLGLLGVDDAVLYPDNLLFIGMLPNRAYATALAEAYNAWLFQDVVTRDDRVQLYGAVLAYPQAPEQAARQIRLWGDDPRAAAVIMPVVGASPAFGDSTYDSIYEAASEVGLPVVFHSGQAIHPTFPFNLHGFDTEFARHAIAHSFSIMATLISVVTDGLPERFPLIKWGFIEGGFTWLPFLRSRLDREFISLRRQAPWLTRLPSQYMAEFFYSTQPLGFEVRSKSAADLMRLCYVDSRLMFSTDWPHHDFDHPDAVQGLSLTMDELERLYSGNALEFFRVK